MPGVEEASASAEPAFPGTDNIKELIQAALDSEDITPLVRGAFSLHSTFRIPGSAARLSVHGMCCPLRTHPRNHNRAPAFSCWRVLLAQAKRACRAAGAGGV
jgi:hypothetical protein